MSEISVNGVTLYYEEHGAGEPILCLHGIGSSAALWTDAAAELARLGRTIVYDRRGFARSERPEPYATDVHQQADDAAALLHALDAAPAIVVGRSYGGTIALDLALRYPDLVRALALLEGDAPSLSEAAASWLADLTDRVVAVGEADPEAVGGAVVRAVAGEESWETLPDPVRQIFTANGPAILAELRGGFPEVTVEQLRAVSQPALLVIAEESLQPGYDEVTSAMAAAMPAARVERVGGGHLIDPAHPVVLAFVEEVLAGPGSRPGGR